MSPASVVVTALFKGPFVSCAKPKGLHALLPTTLLLIRDHVTAAGCGVAVEAS